MSGTRGQGSSCREQPLFFDFEIKRLFSGGTTLLPEWAYETCWSCFLAKFSSSGVAFQRRRLFCLILRSRTLATPRSPILMSSRLKAVTERARERETQWPVPTSSLPCVGARVFYWPGSKRQRKSKYCTRAPGRASRDQKQSDPRIGQRRPPPRGMRSCAAHVRLCALVEQHVQRLQVAVHNVALVDMVQACGRPRGLEALP